MCVFHPADLLVLPPAAPGAGVVPGGVVVVEDRAGAGATKRVKMSGGVSICFCVELKLCVCVLGCDCLYPIDDNDDINHKRPLHP